MRWSLPRSLTLLMGFALVGCTAEVIDASADEALLAVEHSAPRAETDEVPTATVALERRDGRVQELGDARAARLHPRGGALVVDANAALSLVQGDGKRALLDSVVGRPALLPDGRVVASRSTDIGESDLWIVTLDGAPPRALTSTAGADGQPFVLDDGRVLFVSDRTGVVGLYVVDPATREVTPLTNQGERPGRLSDRFVPTPAIGEPRQEGTRVIYDAGDGIWAVDIHTGKAEEVRR